MNKEQTDINNNPLLESSPKESPHNNPLINNTLKGTNQTEQEGEAGRKTGVHVDVRKYIRDFWIPEHLQLEDLLRRHNLGAWHSPARLEKLYLLISIIEHTYLDFEKRGAKRNSFVPISSRTLKEVLGYHSVEGKIFYKLVISVLKRIGVIEENGKYRTATRTSWGFPKSFRLAKPYWNQPVKRISLKTPKPQKFYDRSVITDDVQEFIYSNLKQLQVSDEILYQVLNAALDERKNRISYNAEQFRQGAFNVRGGKNQRRITHALTKCPREMRRAFILPGRQLCEYDIPACQPTLLLHFSDNISSEEDLYYRMVLRGDIYTALGPPDRERAKKQFLRFAFGLYNRENTFGRNFSKRFPERTKIIRSFPPKESGQQTLSCLLQDLEAEMCIYSVVRQFMERGLFVVPVHDSFIIEPSSLEFVQRAVNDEFIRRFRFSVTLKKKWEQYSSDFHTWPEFIKENEIEAAA